MFLKRIKKITIKLNEIFLSTACKLNSPSLCAFFWQIDLFLINFKNTSNLKKKILVLYKSFGSIDLDSLRNNENNEYNFLYLSRKSIKIIFSSFFSNIDHGLTDDIYYSKNTSVIEAKKKYRKFLEETLKIFNKKIIF